MTVGQHISRWISRKHCRRAKKTLINGFADEPRKVSYGFAEEPIETSYGFAEEPRNTFCGFAEETRNKSLTYLQNSQ